MRSAKTNNARKSKRILNRKIPRALPRFVNGIPYETWRNFRFTARVSINNTGATSANNVYMVSDPQWVNQAQTGVSTTLPFHDAVLNMYRQQRVTSASIRVSYANREAFPIEVCITASNFGLTQNDATYDPKYRDQPVAKTLFIGPTTGNSVAVMNHRLTTAKFAGAPDSRVPDSYTGSTDATLTRPTNLWYFIVGATCRGAVFTATGGVDCTIVITMRTRCFEVNDSDT